MAQQLSPMMQQYFTFKNRNEDKIVFFRVGDFYEMFFEDAKLVSKELELTLTGKECGLEERAPMCGVPHHAMETYLARLIAKGYKVAICDQVQDASLAKGLVERDIVRVVTPGTIIENSMLQDDRNNYIASLFLQENKAGVCFADISTGTAHTTLLAGENLAQQIIGELVRFGPREVLFNPTLLKMKVVTEHIKQENCSVELLAENEFEEEEIAQAMRKQFGDEQEKISGAKDGTAVYFAVGGLLRYLQRTQKKGIERLKTVLPYSEMQYMQLSPVTRTNLELTETIRGREKKGTLLWVMDKTETAMGKRLLRRWLEQPLKDVATINSRLDAVQELYDDNVARIKICERLGRVFDIERLMTRVVYGSAAPREIVSLAATCAQLPALLDELQMYESDGITLLRTSMDPLVDIREKIQQVLVEEPPATLKDGGVIREGYHKEADALRDIVHGGKGVLTDIEAKLKEETGIRTLKIGYNKVFGYYIEVSKSFVNQIPEHFIRKQTLTNGERYITDELKKLEHQILGASERLIVLERELYGELLRWLASELVRIQRTAAALAELDVLAGFAQVAMSNDYVRPEVDDGTGIEIREGRHPVVERLMKGALFVPNDTTLNCDENRLMLITGPNMAGKSTYMRQTALIAILGQIGSFVPAKFCHLGVCDAVFTRIGASDDLAQGQSTFMVEMTEVAAILEQATSKSLVVLDEIGRGTSTFDGMSIAQAVVEYISDRDRGPACKTMVATHYHELTDLENAIDGVKNYNIAVKKRGDDVTFLRRIVRGPADDSYGIQVAKLAGLPSSVIERAKEVLKAIEKNNPNTHKVTQLDFEALEEIEQVAIPTEILAALEAVDPETLTPLEALKLVYELKQGLLP